MKTIFIPIFHGHVARNFFGTDVFRILSAEPNLRLVIFVPPHKKEFYEKEFKKENVIFESLDPLLFKASKLEKLITKPISFLVDSDTTYVQHKIKYLEDRNYLKYFLKCFFTKIFAKPPFIKKIVRYIDYKLCPDQIFGKFFDKHYPDLVFSLFVHKPKDVHLLKQAKKRNVFSVGLVNSWDNITGRGAIRVLPNRLIVHNEILKKEAEHYAGMNSKNISISGMQHFDYYFNYHPSPRKEFCKSLNLDPSKRFILFCPPALSLNINWWDVVKFLSDSINIMTIPLDLQIIIRYMPGDSNTDLSNFPKDKNIVHDKPGIPGARFGGKPTDWEWIQKDMNHFVDSLYYGSIVINYASTINLDAAAFNKPVINIAFNNEKFSSPNFNYDMSLDYKSSHIKNLLKTEGGRVVYSEKDLLENINLYLNNPWRDQGGRKKLIEEQCWKFDGKAGQRMANFILSFIQK